MRTEKLNRLEEVLRESVENKEIAGANLCVMYQGKEIYYAQAGMADIAHNRPVKKDTIFRLYSMSKPVTAAAVMKLVEQGVIDLLDPVAKFIPEFANMTVVSGDTQQPANRQITIKDCMNMTSGLTYGGDDPAAKDVEKLCTEIIDRLYSEHPMTTLEFAKKLAGCRIAFQPGTEWRYGTSADLLGAVVEVASGMRFSEYLQKEFFGPLGMTDTGFSVPADKRDRLAVIYETTPDGLIEFHENHLGICNHMDADILFESGGAGLVSTIQDYQKFTQMLLNNGTYNGKEYLAPKTVAYLTGCTLLPHQHAYMEGWDNLPGFSYGNLMRVMVDPSLAVINGSAGEYGWDGWLGPYFSNMPEHNCTFLMMVQKRDAGTFTLTRKLRNVLAAAL